MIKTLFLVSAIRTTANELLSAACGRYDIASGALDVLYVSGSDSGSVMYDALLANWQHTASPWCSTSAYVDVSEVASRAAFKGIRARRPYYIELEILLLPLIAGGKLSGVDVLDRIAVEDFPSAGLHAIERELHKLFLHGSGAAAAAAAATATQAKPTANNEPFCWDLVIQDLKIAYNSQRDALGAPFAVLWDPATVEALVSSMRLRDRIGEERYGVRLQPNNGRDALVDVFQEALDKQVYLKQAMLETSEKGMLLDLQREYEISMQSLVKLQRLLRR